METQLLICAKLHWKRILNVFEKREKREKEVAIGRERNQQWEKLEEEEEEQGLPNKMVREI